MRMDLKNQGLFQVTGEPIADFFGLANSKNREETYVGDWTENEKKIIASLSWDSWQELKRAKVDLQNLPEEMKIFLSQSNCKKDSQNYSTVQKLIQLLATNSEDQIKVTHILAPSRSRSNNIKWTEEKV